METRIDFLQCLQVDMALKILASLDDPSDLVRASAVSRSWHHFVVLNRICKELCLGLFPQLSSIVCVTVSKSTRNSADAECDNTSELETLEKEHRTFAFLGRALTKFTVADCIADTISASSTDNYPEESIHNTLDPRDKVLRRASYWSSKGKSDPGVPETLIYKLIANLCVISEFQIQPFQAYFQPHFPIYSAKFVRFRMGHPKCQHDIENDLRDLPLQMPADDKFIWTYTSPMFPMFQENSLQKFKLPEPVLCIGGYLQIELLGRVQKQEMDGLYYICVSHVKALGQSLFPAFDAEIVEPSGKFLLKYFPENQNQPPPTSYYGRLGVSAEMVQENLRGLEQLLNMLQGNAPDVDLYEWDDDDNDIDFVVM